ncbi:unnamed protein product, partial [Mesorhabditis spiculigera]
MLLKTCRAYQNAIPCFEQRLALCGTRAQRNALEKGKQMYSYLCAPFSLQRQKIFLRRIPCIHEVVNKPMDGLCEKTGLMAKKLASCRTKCHPSDTRCLSKVDASDVSVCTVLRLESQCGIEAAQFYSQMQQVLLNTEYPVQCRYSLKNTMSDLKKKGLPSEPLASPSKTPAENSFEEKIRENMKKIPTTTHRAIRRQARIRTVFIKRPTPASIQLPQFAPPVVITKGRFNDFGTTRNPGFNQKMVIGARPIPNALYMDQPVSKNSLVQRNTPLPTLIPQSATTAVTAKPKLFQWSPPKLTTAASEGLKDFKVPAWYHQIKQNQTTANPLFVFKPQTKDSAPANNAYPAAGSGLGTTPIPFKIQINWLDPETTVSPIKKVTQPSPSIVRLNDELAEDSDAGKPADADSTLPTIDLEDLSHKASRYFNAAVSAIEEKTTKQDGDAWSKIAGIVGPAIQKISPQVIVRLKEELDKIDVPADEDPLLTTTIASQNPAPDVINH